MVKWQTEIKAKHIFTQYVRSPKWNTTIRWTICCLNNKIYRLESQYSWQCFQSILTFKQVWRAIKKEIVILGRALGPQKDKTLNIPHISKCIDLIKCHQTILLIKIWPKVPVCLWLVENKLNFRILILFTNNKEFSTYLHSKHIHFICVYFSF